MGERRGGEETANRGMLSQPRTAEGRDRASRRRTRRRAQPKAGGGEGARAGSVVHGHGVHVDRRQAEARARQQTARVPHCARGGMARAAVARAAGQYRTGRHGGGPRPRAKGKLAQQAGRGSCCRWVERGRGEEKT